MQYCDTFHKKCSIDILERACKVGINSVPVIINRNIIPSETTSDYFEKAVAIQVVII